jgi:hypothetical protein
MPSKHELRKALFALAVATSAALPLSAQETRGTIAGRVTDPSGAVISGATVDVVNKAMGTKVTLTTNEAGAYQATLLIAGPYRVEAAAPGFKRFVRDNIELRINARLNIDLPLELGAAEQSITVVDEVPLLDTASASLGNVIDARRVQDLPVAHGNPLLLMGLATGVAFTRNPRLDRPFEPTHIVGFAIDGTRANRSDVTIDGVAATATAGAREVIASYVPPADLVAEFKVQTATFDAAFGQTEGGVTNISIKSGTNTPHGTLYYQNMVPELFANDFFANRAGLPRPDFTYHRWGGTFGGPVRIPKLYDGRNKTFIMYGYEGIAEARPRNDGVPTVPTMPMRGGDFSALLAHSPAFQIFNPFTRRAVGGGRFRVDPFPGNIVPASLINPVSNNIQQFFAAPRTPALGDGSMNFLNPELMETIDYGTHTIRLDHNIGERHRVFGRVSWYDRWSDYNNYFGNLSTGNHFGFISRSAVLDHVYTVTPSTVVNFRYGYNRFVRTDDSNPAARGFDLTTLGLPRALNDAIPAEIRRFPRILITGYQGTSAPGFWMPNDVHNFISTVQQTRGSHFLKAGFEFRAYRENQRFFANDQTAQMEFGNTWTRGPFDNSPPAPGSFGQSYASFLLGLPTGGVLRRAPDYAEQSLSYGFFIQDDWRVNSRLTLNLGLRWEFEGPLTERFNRTVQDFDRGFVPGFESAIRAGYARHPTGEIPADQFFTRGGLTFAGVGGNPRGAFPMPMMNLMPRFGLAYRLDSKTVLRGGYGIFYGFLGQRRGDVVQHGWAANTPLIPSRDVGLTFDATISNPFPHGIMEPVGNALGGYTFAGQSVTFFNQRPRNSYMQRWQFGIQRELARNMMLEVSYVGNRGTNIELGQNLNVTPQRFLSTLPTRDNPHIDHLTTFMPNPFRGHMPADAFGLFHADRMMRERFLLPFPHMGAVNWGRFDGFSWYHSLQVNFEKRYSQGLVLLANYTFSKFMQASEVLMQDDLRPHEVISDLDRPHRLTLSGVYDLPFGRGKQFGATVSKFTNALIGGWQLNGIYTYQSGAPLPFGNIIFDGDINNIALPRAQQSVERWFNMDAGFERRALWQLERNVRTFPLRFGFIRNHHMSNVDFSAIKNNVIREKYNLQFRFETLNTLNRPHFPGPNMSPAVAAFGQILASNQANYARRIQAGFRLVF